MALTPSEKLDLIKSSAASLADEGWTNIDVTLAVFGISGYGEDWRDIYYYIAQSLSDASDDALIGLHAHLNDEAPLATASTQVGPWQKDHFRLFFSHTHPNKKLAAEIRTNLLDRGIDLFVAHEMIEPTKEWMEEISIALATCDAMVALLTSDFADSAYCDQELGFALSRDVLIIPIRHGADPHGFISKFQALPGDTSQMASHNLAGAIFEVLVASPKTTAKLAPAIVQRYSTAHSYDDARANLSRLQQIPAVHWTAEMIEKVEKAGRENSQLENGIYYNERIPAAASRHLDELLGADRPRFPVGEKDPGWVPAPSSEDDIPF
ncbi:MAG TPA: toll/interleukin-1 receptor domain-containing protein [Solirubrobacterales bacterium]